MRRFAMPLKSLIRSVSLSVELFGSPGEFFQAKRPDTPSCLVLDVMLPGESGLDLQRESADANIHIPIIFITGHRDIPMSVKAMKAGDIEFLNKHSATRICWMPFKWRWRPDAPSCLILDVKLPCESGLDLQRELVAADMHVPIISIAGHGDIPMSVRAKKAGAVEFLTKPFRDQDLLDAIQPALKRDRTRRVQEAEIAILREGF